MSYKTDSGKRLNVVWGIGAQHALYHKNGNWYERLERFPGALCDPKGYIIFKTEEEFLNCLHLDIATKVHVKGGGAISEIPGYVKVVN